MSLLIVGIVIGVLIAWPIAIRYAERGIAKHSMNRTWDGRRAWRQQQGQR